MGLTMKIYNNHIISTISKFFKLFYKLNTLFCAIQDVVTYKSRER